MVKGGSLSLAGRRAVVTGAGRRIGKAIALALAGAGPDVAAPARTGAELEPLAAEREATGHRCVFATCDVTDVEQVNKAAARLLEDLGGVDILVNNAGNAESHKFLGHPDDLWHRMLAANLTSVYYVTKAFLPAMVEQRSGRII